jgi:hypothetical protein
VWGLSVVRSGAATDEVAVDDRLDHDVTVDLTDGDRPPHPAAA